MRPLDLAIAWADHRSISSSDGNLPCQAENYFIEACAYAQMREVQSARAALATGNACVRQTQKQNSTDFANDWADWAIADHLRREAEELLDKRPARPVAER